MFLPGGIYDRAKNKQSILDNNVTEQSNLNNKVTWGFAWSLYWKLFVINLIPGAILAVIGLIIFFSVW